MYLLKTAIWEVTHRILNPFIGLALRVDEQWPPPGVLDHDSILHRQVVLGEPGNLPAPDLDGVAKGRDE